MSRKTLVFLSLLLGLVLASAWAAQGEPYGSVVPRGKWWKMPRLAGELALSDEEKAKLDDLFFSYRGKVIDIKSEIERGWLELDHLLEKENLDEAAALEAFARVNTARSKLAIEGFRFLLEVRKILGAERYQRLKVLFREIRNRRKASRPRPNPGPPSRD